MKKIGTILLVIIMILMIAGIGFLGYGYYRKLTMEVKNPIVTMEVENFGTVKMELYPDQAPESVANFVTLANRGFYDGLTFHRIMKDFMIQGGDKKGDGSGSATLGDLRDNGGEDEYTIKGEFVLNNVKNTIKFEEGVLAMARSDYTQYSSTLKEESYNSGSSQFFIMTGNNTELNGKYAAFGRVIEGMDVVKAISEVEVKEREDSNSSTGEATAEESTEGSSEKEVSQPVNPPKITSIRVDTFGVNYGEPQTFEPFDYMSWMYKQYGIDPSQLTQEQTVE